jgi:hypothetical protein
MQGVRVEIDKNTFFIDVICDCGKNGLIDEETRNRSFKHEMKNPGETKVLICECGKKYSVKVSKNHVYVINF